MRYPIVVVVMTLALSAGSVAQDRRAGALRPGDSAPDFSLAPRGGEATVTLSSFLGKLPVALVFGSYT